MAYLVHVEYTIEGQFGINEEFENDIRDCMSGEDVGSGSGFGYRDICFSYEDEETAKADVALLRKQFAEVIAETAFNVSEPYVDDDE